MEGILHSDLLDVGSERRMEPEAGLEPATTRLVGDNPILRPVESKANKFWGTLFADFLTVHSSMQLPQSKRSYYLEETLAARLCRSPDRCYLRSVKINVHLRLALK